MESLRDLAVTVWRCVLAQSRIANVQTVSLVAGIVRWARGEDFGIGTLVMDSEAQARLDHYIREGMKTV